MTDRSESAETDVAEVGGASGESGGEEAEESDADDSGHLADVKDGAGCTEIWEHLSERRETEKKH